MDVNFNKIKESMLEGLDARLNKDCADEELWIVQEFLSKHTISFNESDIYKEPEDSKIDVVFKDCNFQVKKIIYPSHYKPNEEDKYLKENIINAHTRDELVNATVLGPFDHQGWHNPKVLKDIIIEKSKYWSCKKSKNKNKLKYEDDMRLELDLLFYVQSDLNHKRLTGFTFDQEAFNQICNLGWRSVSYLFGSQSLVLYTADNAPDLIKKIYSTQG